MFEVPMIRYSQNGLMKRNITMMRMEIDVVLMDQSLIKMDIYGMRNLTEVEWLDMMRMEM